VYPRRVGVRCLVTHSSEKLMNMGRINPALRELVLSAHPGEAQDLASLSITAERVDNTSMLKTPFQELLANYSYHGTASAESDSD